MSTLKEKAEQILQEKEEKIIPGEFLDTNIIFGIGGSFGDERDTNIEAAEYPQITDTPEEENVVVVSNPNTDDIVVNSMTNIESRLGYSELAQEIGLTDDILKEGNVVLGINGTVQEGIDTSDATATEDDILFGKTAYIDGAEVTGKIPTYDYYTDTSAVQINHIEDDTVNHKLDMMVNIDSCSYENGVFVGPEEDMPTSIAYAQLVPEIGLTADKIVAGETILGVEGTAEGIDTSDATATENDIVAGKSAYIDGELVYGNIEVPKSTGYGNAYLDSVIAKKGGGDTIIFGGKASLYDRVVIDRGIDVNLWVSEAEVRELIGGTDTSDATAVAGDLAMGKTAYVKGSKIVGTIPVYSEYSYKAMTPSVKELGPNNTVTILGTMDIDKSVLLKPSASVELAVPQSSIASTAGLVANKIKLGETILGVTGTFQGDGVTKIHINYSTSVITVHCGVIVDMLMSAISAGVISGDNKLQVSDCGLSPICIRLCDVEPLGNNSILPGYIGIAVSIEDVSTYLVYVDGNEITHTLGAIDEYGSNSEYTTSMAVSNLITVLSNIGDIEIRFSHEELENANLYNEFITTFYEFLSSSGHTVVRGKLQANSDTMTISEV